MRRDVFQAIADPTRREIIKLIAQRPLPLNSIAENFEVSRPAISKHIRILTECGIVMIHTRGRERYCEAQLQKLHEVTQWVDYFKTYWNQKLDALGEFLDTQKGQQPRKAATEQQPQKAATGQQPRKAITEATGQSRKAPVPDSTPLKKKNKTYGKSTSRH
jgi:DNA-binding transcriptional ArsR family regulator